MIKVPLHRLYFVACVYCTRNPGENLMVLDRNLLSWERIVMVSNWEEGSSKSLISLLQGHNWNADKNMLYIERCSLWDHNNIANIRAPSRYGQSSIKWGISSRTFILHILHMGDDVVLNFALR